MQNELRLLHYYWELLWRRPIIWIVPALAVLLIGTAYVLMQPRTYTAESTIVVNRKSPTLVESTIANERLQFIEQRVLARGNLIALAEKFDLFPGLRKSASKTLLAATVRKSISITSESSQPFDQNPDRVTIRVRFDGDSPELVAAVTNEIVSMIVEENRRSRLSQATDTTKFLEREVSSLNERLRALDKQWDEFVKANQNALPNRQTAHLDEIRAAQTELSTIDTRSSEIASEIQLLKAELDIRLPLADATLRGRTEQLAALKAQLGTRLSVLSEAHPEIKTLRSQIAALEEELSRASVRTTKVGPDGIPNPEDLEPELGLIAERIKAAQQRQAALAEQRAKVTANLETARGIIAHMPEVEAEMTNLERQRTTTQRELDEMMVKLNTARLSERLEFDQQADQIQVLEAAEVPQYASGPKRKRMMIVVVGLALVAGAAAVFLMDIMDKTIRGAFDLTRALDGRSLVVVPDWSEKPAAGFGDRLRNMFAGLFLLAALGQAVHFLYNPANETMPLAPVEQAI